MAKQVDPQWYKKIWTLDIEDTSWVEYTKTEVDFIFKELSLQGTERVLDIACGFGRHSLELARRGFSVVGIDMADDAIGYLENDQENLKIFDIVARALDAGGSTLWGYQMLLTQKKSSQQEAEISGADRYLSLISIGTKKIVA